VADGLYGLFRSHFPRELDRPVIDRSDGTCRSYRELDSTSARYAALLRSLGIAKGDRVVVQVEKSPEALFLDLACLRSGAVYVPLNPAYTAAEIAYYLDDAEPAVVVCRPEDESRIGAIAGPGGGRHVLTLGDVGDGSLVARSAVFADGFPPSTAGGEDLAAILYTSGTTGRSKGAMLSHANLAANASTLIACWEFRDGDVLIHALPIFHAHGLFVAIHTTLLAGARMLFLPRFDADAVVRMLPRATVFMGVPTFYTRLLAHPALDRASCGRMRLFISGSAPLAADTHRSFLDRTGHAILERYGMTETGMNTANPLHGDRVAGSVGTALPGVEVRIVGEQGAVVGAGEIGVLEVRGPNVFRGYWRMPEKTRAEFRDDGFFITGDIGRIDDRGYVTLVGRARDLIISGGLNVYPKEVEAVIDRIDGIVESAVFAVPHPDFGEAVVAAVVRRAGHEVDEAAITRAARQVLAAYKTPKRVVVIAELPRNAMGKVQKNVLEERYQHLFD
jgi:malonyl-CoA/methylmalonyl-CoA synthetase